MNCILCGGGDFGVVATKLRNDVARRVVRCAGCSLVSLEDPQTGAVDYSQAEYRKQHGPVLGRESSPAEMFEISFPLMEGRVERVKSLIGPLSEVVEVGCATGYFLHAVRDRVRRAVGIEPNPSHAAFIKERFGIEVINRTLESSGLVPGQFDVVFFFQVLEHISDPFPFLEHCRRLLKPGGTIYVEVPNLEDALLSVFGLPAYRDFYYKAPHAYYYSRETLPRLMKKAGFQGTVRTAQGYTLFNHIHWLQTGKPQASLALGCTPPAWTHPEGAMAPVAAEVAAWFKTIDAQYRDLLSRCGAGEILCFEGRAS